MTGFVTPTQREALRVAREAAVSPASAYGVTDTIVVALRDAGLLRAEPVADGQLAEIRGLLDGAPSAVSDLIKSVAEAVRDRRGHAHPKGTEDWFCANLAGWMGDRMPVVLSRLLDAEAEVKRLREERREKNEWLEDTAKAIRAKDERIAELERLYAAAKAERDVEIINWLAKKASELRGLPRHRQESAPDAVIRLADKLSRGAVRPAGGAS